MGLWVLTDMAEKKLDNIHCEEEFCSSYAQKEITCQTD